MLKVLVVSLLIVGVLSQAQPNPESTPGNSTSEGVKEQPGAGRYYGGHGHRPGYGWGYPWGPSYDPPIVDDYICDLDATILVVTNSDSGRDDGYGRDGDNGRDEGYGGNDRGRDGYGGNDRGRDGYGYDNNNPNADRLKCSVIASDDNESCSTCCKLAARRVRSIAQNDIVGFIVDEDQIDRDQNNDNRDRDGPYRVKRENYSSAPTADATFRRGGGYRFLRNPICVCCAPRQFGFPHPRPFYHHRRGGY